MSVRAVFALTRASWLTAWSYRVSMMLSLLWLVLSIVPVFFVAAALQPIMAASIHDEGGQYFGFILLGTVLFSLLSTALTALPSAIGSGISSGFFEALIATPTRVAGTLTGLVGYNYSWSVLRGVVLLCAGALLGADVAWGRVPEAVAILMLILIAYTAVGLIAAASVLAFRTQASIPQVALVFSGLLGGVYYPTSVIPKQIQELSAFVPLTYGLRALRRVLLDGRSLASVMGDVGPLALYAIGLTFVGGLVFAAALRHARRAGSLSQY